MMEVSEYLDSRLSSRRVAQVEAHVATCAVCREEMESLRATVTALHRLPTHTPRRSFVFAAPPMDIAAAMPQRRVPSWAYGAVASACALAFVVLLSVDIGGVLKSATPLPSQETASMLTNTAAPEREVTATQEQTTPPLARPAIAEKAGAQDSFDAAPTPAPANAPDTNTPSATEGEKPPVEGLQPSAPSAGRTPWGWHLIEGLLGSVALAIIAIFAYRRVRTAVR